MLQTIFDFVRPWPVLAQMTSLIVISGLLTLVTLALISLVSDFINVTLPILCRGYGPVDAQEPDEETK